MSLLVFEGLDGSGKSTQAKLFCENLRRTGTKVKEIDFPNYASPSAAPVKMYLNGELSANADEVNAYAASSLFAVDRYCTFMTDWRRDYEAGTLIFANRYVTSNLVFQLGKLPKAEWDSFIAWLCEFEYGKLGLPEPDAVVYLDVPIAVSQKLLTGRYGGDESKKDIHERDLGLLARSRESAMYLCEKLNWLRIDCADGEGLRTVEDIGQEIQEKLAKYL